MNRIVRRKRVLSLLLAGGLLLGIYENAVHNVNVEDKIWSVWNSEKQLVNHEKVEPGQLYAQSAVLMDADTGRILFEKEGAQARPMASTTKIMTCILALESGTTDQIITAGSTAASQPKVRMGVREGMQFQLHDLLYSLMLESHNDAAVMIAEGVAGSVEGFADLMNQKAEELGCADTYFVTPNGLDGTDEGGAHHTTAEDLAKIMRYCIMQSEKRQEFLEITRSQTYQFTDISGTSTYSCSNHNAFLQMMEGALSGKTGFTGNAGYCYVGSLQAEDRTFIVSLLACGWPNNKGYKWEDTRVLMEYAKKYYVKQNIWQELELPTVSVVNGVPMQERLSGESYAEVYLDTQERELEVVCAPWERTGAAVEVKKNMTAPVKKDVVVGAVRYLLGDEILAEYPLRILQDIEERTYIWCLRQVFERYTFSMEY